ncbi:MAG: hypothetical protein U5M50_08560 [Sphingobium sp.]|nr:hypothetical protein [Sphingobium sp.]
MSNMIIVAPMDFVGIAVGRGSGGGNLVTPDPKEVWADSSAADAASISIDLGSARSIDTIFLGHVYGATADAAWTIRGGIAANDEFTIAENAPLRVPDVAGRFESMSHALRFGAAITARYLRIWVAQGAGGPPLMIGRAIVGKAFQPALNREWGSGRKIIDTGSATPLPSGGFGISEGVRKRSFAWTFGDLSEAEVDALEAVALECGETRTVLVVEDPAQTAGLRSRIHYGLFQKLTAFERRNPAQTRWEFTVEQWV